jgi:tryptophan halogenase
MWHFESRAAAAYFKKIGIERGITLVEGEYNISTRDIAGNISSIGLDHDRQISADWFFDCSGFARLLLEKTLGEKIVDYSDYFPARAVVAWWDEPETSLTTNAIAMKYGWSWNINLRHRSGNGYLYNPDMITLDQAVNEAETRFNKKIDPIANFTFVPGIMKNSWKNNVIGIGLSSGFLEPLEANGVAVIIEALYALHDHWDPHDNNSDYSIARFNDKVFTITDDIKDFLALHYRGQRRDTEFWLDHHHNPKRTPESLRQKLWIWNTYFDGRSDTPIFNGYSPTAWLTVIQGLNIFNNTALKNQVENKLELGRAILNNTKSKYETMVNPHWTIDEWILKTA